MQTSYDVLGVPRNASNEAIRAAFRRAAKAYHPDLNAGDPTGEQQLKQVLAAYEVLRNRQQRAAYDQALADCERYQRNNRIRRIRRFAAVPLAALFSAGIVALWVSLWSGAPHASGPAGGKIADLASQEVADVHGSDSPAAYHSEAQASLATEWERVRASGDAMATWAFAIRNPDVPEAELARSKLVELIDTADDMLVLNALRVGAAGAIGERAQQRLMWLSARQQGEATMTVAKEEASASHALEERAASFISAQVSAWSSARAVDLASVASVYADQVIYYGSLKSRQAVLVDKRHLLERWPERLYEVQPDSVMVQCAADVCKVSGLIDWQTRSPRRAASASGIARFEYQIALSGAAFNIISESSSVVRPQRTGL